jgi:hypothetical protein
LWSPEAGRCVSNAEAASLQLDVSARSSAVEACPSRLAGIVAENGLDGSRRAQYFDEARKAIDEFIGRSLVFFVPGRANATAQWVASGILFATQAGAVPS